MRKMVLDTNVLISAFLFHERDGVPIRLLRKAAAGGFALITSEMLLDELEGVLRRDASVQERYGYSPETAGGYRLLLEGLAAVVEPQEPFPAICRDSDDDVLIATAVAGNADSLVTGDNDLLSLKQYEGIRILTPRSLLEELS